MLTKIQNSLYIISIDKMHIKNIHFFYLMSPVLSQFLTKFVFLNSEKIKQLSNIHNNNR